MFLQERGDRYTMGSNARETAYRTIRDRIIFLDLKPGDVLNDKSLAQEMNMSRTPVREALLLLSRSGMVTMKPQASTYVNLIDLERVEVEQEARFAVEKEVIARVCQDPPPSLRRQYQENLHLYHFFLAECTEQKDRERQLLDLDNAFHQLTFAAAGKSSLFSYIMGSVQHIERIRSLTLLMDIDDHVYDDHMRLADTITSKDTDEAIHTLEVHMGRYREHMALIQEQFPQYVLPIDEE